MGDTTKFVVRLVAATLDQTIQSTSHTCASLELEPILKKNIRYALQAGERVAWPSSKLARLSSSRLSLIKCRQIPIGCEF
jgi:hypothetical protein